MPKEDGTGSPAGFLPRRGRKGGTRAGAGPGGSCVCPTAAKSLGILREYPATNRPALNVVPEW
jgi:hypothetical protein